MPTDAQRAYTAIERALRAGDLGEVRAACATDPVFPNVRDPLTWTPLLALAISWSPLSLIEQLLQLGATPNYEADNGFPAAFAALSTERTDRREVLRLLLTHGADPNARGINDYTPLHLAVSQRDEQAMELLLAHGADPSLKTRIDECATPIDEAELTGNAEGADMLRRLLSKPRPNT
jgi:ankyrin repeat protein